MSRKVIPIVSIAYGRAEEQAVLRVLRSGYLAQASQVERFEKEFASYLGCKYAVAVANGTAALHIAVLSLGLGPGDEVITTPFSFAASANVILLAGATPVFVDIGEDYTINAAAIERAITGRTRAILPVHLYGNPCDMESIMRIAKRHKLAVIEDACQAHGAAFKTKKVGTIGDVGCFSFYATKNMTTGEGGMIVTNNKKIYEYATMARTHGSKTRYYHEFIGYNYRMTEMCAALGRVQLGKLDRYNAKRRRNAALLTKKLRGVAGLVLPRVKQETTHVFHQYTVRVTKDFLLSRKKLIDVLARNKIGHAIYYPMPIHMQRYVQKMKLGGRFPKSEQYSREVLSLPVHPGVTEQDISFMAKIIRAVS